MAKIAATLAALCSLFFASPNSLSAQPISEPPTNTSVVLKWLGVAGCEIQFGQTVILIDPFLTRKEPGSKKGTFNFSLCLR